MQRIHNEPLHAGGAEVSAPPLVALVYRVGAGCKQYAFGTVEELEKWAARHPYRNEMLWVHPVGPGKTICDKKMLHARFAADFVRGQQEWGV